MDYTIANASHVGPHFRPELRSVKPPEPPPKRAPSAQPPQPDRHSSLSQTSRVARPSDALPIAARLTGGETADDLEKARAIRDVMEHAVNQTLAVALAKEMKSWRARPIILAFLALVSVSLCAYTLVAEADWAYGPDPAAVSLAKREADLRFAMFLIAERLEEHRAANGALPRSLTQIGEWPGIEYRMTDSLSYALVGRDSLAGEISLRSIDSPSSFLGRSRDYLREPPR